MNEHRTSRSAGSARLRAVLVALVTFAGATFFVSSVQAHVTRRTAEVVNSGDTTLDRPHALAATTGGGNSVRLPDSLAGLSGNLRAIFVRPKDALALPMLRQLFGDSTPQPAAPVTVQRGSTPFSIFALRPFSEKVHGRIGDYRMGTWPYEHGTPRTAAYANPRGFIEVTRANARTPVSEHFHLGDFLTKNQAAVWPKYVVLRPQLLDKLELVIEDLNAHGIPVRHMAVMSGFRTPEYNAPGVGAGGRAKDSRHQYGDAADVFVDNDGDGWMDDLNHDGRVDARDAHVLLDAVNRVEAAHPEVVGGVGVYRATAAHGPFAHIDARGYRARWGLI